MTTRRAVSGLLAVALCVSWSFGDTRAADAAPAIVAGEFVGAAVAVAFRQPRTPDAYTLLYDPDRRIALRGPVLEICRVPLEEDRLGILVRITEAGKLYCVFLGPVDYLERNGIRLMVGDFIDVAGTPAYLDDRCCLIADRIRALGVSLKLRDANGQPLWVD